MEGVILAGGEGTRLGTSKIYNKQLALVYDRPMIEYPIDNMKAMGVDFVHVVTTPQGHQDLFGAYRDEINGMPVRYHEQMHPNGSADALGKTALEGVFPVLCGDVYFDPPLPQRDKPTLFWHEFPGAENHSVWNPETGNIIEKPAIDIGRRAIVGYYYDDRVYDVIDHIEPSDRGELELVDIHRWYLANGVEMEEYRGFFSDMGTPEGIRKVANHTAYKEAQKHGTVIIPGKRRF